MLQKYSWIALEKKLFGTPNSDYDFESNNPTQAGKRLKSLQSRQETLSKSINKKVMSMFENAEKEYQDLQKKKQQIEKDKEKNRDGD